VKVTTQVVVDDVEISVADKDQSSAPKANKLQYPNKISVEADPHQRLILKFSVKEASSKQIITAHQTFVRLTNTKTKQEVIFLAEEDSGSSYKFDLDVGAKAKDFNNLAGKYTADLIVGDAVFENAISWTVADVQLKFQDDAIEPAGDKYRYAKKPEIKHLFRELEVRPPASVSSLFTGLVLLPILILLALWMKIGANISNFKFSLSALGFHLGLAAIFALYLCYFLHLTMFETLRYLGLIGIPTFLFGNKLLSGIAASRGGKK
jgi:oligosaccharyltransferase complex subunit delta (ribophorin II)